MRMYIESLCLILYERNMREPQELKYIGHKVMHLRDQGEIDTQNMKYTKKR